MGRGGSDIGDERQESGREDSIVVDEPSASFRDSVRARIREEEDGGQRRSALRDSVRKLVRAVVPSVDARGPRASRRELALDAIVTAPTGRRYAFRTINVSPTGILVGARIGQELPFRTGIVCSVRVLAKDIVVDFDAEIVRTIEDEAEAAHAFALEIVRIGEAHRAALSRLLAAPDTSAAAQPRRGRARALVLALAGVLVAGGSAGALALRYTGSVVSASAVRVARGDVTEITSSSSDGQVVAKERATIRAPSSPSRVLEVKVARGDRVKKGALLVVLDSTPLQHAVNEARAHLAVAEAQLRQVSNQARVAAERVHREERLLDSGAISEQLVREAKNAQIAADDGVVVATAAVDDARTALAGREEDLRRTRITAPFDGVVAELEAHAGDTVAAPAVLVELVDDARFAVEVPFAEADAPRLREGMRATVSVPGERAPIDAKVRKIHPTVRTDAKGVRSVSVELEVSPSVRLRPGTTANADVIVDRSVGVLFVPLQHVTGHGQSRAVLTVGQDGRLVQRSVTVGRVGAERVEITGGLEEGEIVVDPTSPGVALGERVTPVVR